jgi:Co/Zn/Cd efflux system component
MALLADGWHMAIVSLAAEHSRPPHHDKRLIHAAVGLSHLTVEVNPRAG